MSDQDSNAGGGKKVPVPIRNEIASITRDIFHWWYADIALPRDNTLMQRGGSLGLWIYDDLERDARVFSAMQKRRSALNAYRWKVDPGGPKLRDKQAAKIVETLLGKMNFANMVENLQDAVLKGFSVGEVMWDVVDDMIAPVEVIPRDQRRFKFTVNRELRLLTYENMLEGIALPDRKFIVHRRGAKDGNPYGLGIGTVLFWPVLFKKMDISFWLTFLDKFGSPTPVGVYPPGAGVDDQNKLMAALEAIANESGVIIPENMKITYLEATRTGTIDAYESMCRYMDEQIAEATLGETLSTNIGSTGSKAASETHNAVRLELAKADGDQLDDTLNKTVIQWIVDLNVPGAKTPLLVHQIDEEDDLDARAERDSTIFNMGFDPDEDYINETYGGNWKKRPKAAAPAPGALSPDALPMARAGNDTDAAFAEGARAPTVADRMADRLAGDAAPIVESMVAHVKRLFAECGSLEEARDRLLELFPKLDAHQFAEVMTKALTAADLAGRREVKGG